MSDITFQVIDLTCEKTDQSFFPPRISMTTRSQTKISKILGFDEYIPSTPPKRYKTITWSGHSQHEMWYLADTPGNPGPAYQVGGARYDYSGASTIDLSGAYTSLYTKNLSVMCDGVGVGNYTGLVPGVNGGLDHYPFAGWIGATGQTLCPPPGIPFTSVGNGAIGKGQAARNDSSNLWGRFRPNPAVSNVQVSTFAPVSSTQAVSNDINTVPQLVEAGVISEIISLFTPLPLSVSTTIDNTNQGTIWFFTYLLWDHDYSATLSNEYTDADALSVARIVNGNGSTAQNVPRTTGFVNSVTAVTFQLQCSNLIVGQSYLVSYDLWDQTAGTISTTQVGFVAADTTHNINSSIPTPAAGHSVTVRNQKIAFSPA